MFCHIPDILSLYALFRAVRGLRSKQDFYPCLRLSPYCKWRQGIGHVGFHCSFLGQGFLSRPRDVFLYLAPCIYGDSDLRAFELFYQDPKDRVGHHALDDLRVLEVVVTLGFFPCCCGMCLLWCGGSSLRFPRLSLLIARQSLPIDVEV